MPNIFRPKALPDKALVLPDGYSPEIVNFADRVGMLNIDRLVDSLKRFACGSQHEGKNISPNLARMNF